jgi:hypothetical protein
MSAEVLGPVSPAAPEVASQATAGDAPFWVEPSLLNRLLAVAAAVFALPGALVVQRAASGAGLTALPSLGWTLVASGLLAAGFAALLHRTPRVADLRPARTLCLVLVAEVAVLALGYAGQLLAS